MVRICTHRVCFLVAPPVRTPVRVGNCDGAREARVRRPGGERKSHKKNSLRLDSVGVISLPVQAVARRTPSPGFKIAIFASTCQGRNCCRGSGRRREPSPRRRSSHRGPPHHRRRPSSSLKQAPGHRSVIPTCPSPDGYGYGPTPRSPGQARASRWPTAGPIIPSRVLCGVSTTLGAPIRACMALAVGMTLQGGEEVQEAGLRSPVSFAKSASESPGDYSCACDALDPQGDRWAVVPRAGPSASSGHRPRHGKRWISVWDGWRPEGRIGRSPCTRGRRVAAAEEWKESKQVEQRADHGRRLSPDQS